MVGFDLGFLGGGGGVVGERDELLSTRKTMVLALESSFGSET